MKQRTSIFIVCAVALILTACPVGMNPPVTVDPDLATVQQAKDTLQIGYASGDSAFSVTQDITLATSAPDGVSISWASDKQATISNTGTVIRPLVGQPDAAVSITATLTKNSTSLTKTFNLTVLARTLAFTKTNDWQTFAAVSLPSVNSIIQDGTKIYAGTSNKGLLYSANEGSSWSVINKAADHIADDQIYAVRVSGYLVLLGTYDGLTVWNRNTASITNYLSGKQIYDIAIDGTTLYFATSAGIYRIAASSIASIDTATPYATSFPYPSRLYLDGANLYVSGDSTPDHPEELNVFNTADMSAAPGKIDVVAGTASTVGPVYANGQTLLVGIDYALYRSANGGTSFTEDLTSGGGTITGFADTGSYLVMVKYGSSLWYSFSAGATWLYADVPGYTSFAGIMAKGIFWNGTELMIAHSKGIVTGKLE